MKKPRFIPSKVLYLWEKCGLKRIELFTQEDVAKKPEIPTVSIYGRIHQRILNARRKKKHGKGH